MRRSGREQVSLSAWRLPPGGFAATLIASFYHGGNYSGAAPHDSNCRSARPCLQINHGNAVESRPLPMCHLNELEPQLHPLAQLQNV